MAAMHKHGTVEPVVETATETMVVSLPVLITVSVLSGLALVALGIVILCCCQQKRDRKRSTASRDFILPNTPTSPSYVETVVQDNDSSELDDFPVNNNQEKTTRAKLNSFGGVSSSTPSSSALNFRRSSSMSVFDILPDEVDVGMYSGYDSGAEDPRSPSIHGLGKLCFSLAYDKKDETLSVTVVRALFLSPRRRSKTTADPYVKVIILPDKRPKYVSKIVRKSLNPIFDETFVFPCQGAEIKGKTLRMTVCDYDRFSRQTAMGYVSMDLATVDFDATPWTEDIWRDLYDGSPVITCRGQLLFSLSFDPNMGNIRIGILKAKELQSPARTDKEIDGVFVKACMLMNERVVKTKKSKVQRKSSSPVFNDEFTFNVHPSLMGDVSFVLSVHSRNAFGKNVLLGKTNTGSFVYATGQGLAHWSDMLAAPRSNVAQWHVL